jgi:hypothetical protein
MNSSLDLDSIPQIALNVHSKYFKNPKRFLVSDILDIVLKLYLVKCPGEITLGKGN